MSSDATKARVADREQAGLASEAVKDTWVGSSRPFTEDELAAKRRGKNWAAVSSMLFAILLTGTKLAIGLITGSLGILSEALHSGMDFVGTALSFGAVRISNRPPDASHPYGHAKFESLSALAAVLILTITALGILREAYNRVFVEQVVPSVSIWGFLVIILSVSVDFTRSRYLRRMAERYGSQALAADAAHFATDLYSSMAVLFGLAVVAAGTFAGWPSMWLTTVDALAGSVVACIIITVAFRLATRAVNSLTDRVPETLVARVTQTVASIEGTLGDPAARVRFVGDQPFADVSIGVPRGLSLERAKSLCDEVVARVQEVVPHADVVVRTVPVAPDTETAVEVATVAAARFGLGVHHVRAFETPAGLRLDLHMEVPESMKLDAAHDEADRLESVLRQEISGLVDVQVHIEPRHTEVHILTDGQDSTIPSQIAQAASSAAPGVHDVEVLWSEHGYLVTVHCYMPADLPVAVAHSRTAEVEKAIRDRVPGVFRVTVHPEPGV